MNGEAAQRCGWEGTDPLMIAYHDQEWGVPLHDDTQLFEFLVLEGAQAGLSWATVLRKRARYREVFSGFDPESVAAFDRRKIDSMLQDPGIIRNRLKLEAAVSNAAAFLQLQQEFGSFDRFIWQFVENEQPRINRRRRLADLPAQTPESGRMSRELKRRGFRFVGSTICYAFMQAVGMVNDHTLECFRYRQLGGS